MKQEIIQQGAEAILIKKDKNIIKRRIKKSYRLPILDEKIRKQRTKSEARLLEKASKLIPIPQIIKINEKDREIELEFINGKKLSPYLDSLPNALEICNIIGKRIACLHDADIIHGDLTTSNIIFAEKKVYFLDFGLGFSSSKVEDKAVDIHLIKQALEAKHFINFESYFKEILLGYKSSKNSALVLKRLQAVEKRGRYKQSY